MTMLLWYLEAEGPMGTSLSPQITQLINDRSITIAQLKWYSSSATQGRVPRKQILQKLNGTIVVSQGAAAMEL